MADAFQSGMVQCEITGQWHPEDEIITLHGKRVSAEGKQILIEKLKAGERLPGEMERASALQRFGGMFVDNLIFTILAYALIFLVIIVMNSSPNTSQEATAKMVQAVQWGNFLLSSVYFVLMHGNQGQSYGKLAARTKVVREDGSPIDMRTSLIRTMAYQGPVLLGLGAVVIGLEIIGGLICLVAIILFFTSIFLALADTTGQRTFHDRIAKTRVVRVD